MKRIGKGVENMGELIREDKGQLFPMIAYD